MTDVRDDRCSYLRVQIGWQILFLQIGSCTSMIQRFPATRFRHLTSIRSIGRLEPVRVAFDPAAGQLKRDLSEFFLSIMWIYWPQPADDRHGQPSVHEDTVSSPSPNWFWRYLRTRRTNAKIDKQWRGHKRFVASSELWWPGKSPTRRWWKPQSHTSVEKLDWSSNEDEECLQCTEGWCVLWSYT